jgi:hypothetical protein
LHINVLAEKPKANYKGRIGTQEKYKDKNNKRRHVEKI